MLATKDILGQLEPVVEQLLERHLSATRNWSPHEPVPWSRGEDFDPDHQWTPTDSDLDGAVIDDDVRSALVVNLLTEDNLPYYFRSVEKMFGADGAWGTWVRRWTAEEQRHSMVIWSYLMTTRAVDPEALEQARMAQVSGGVTPDPASVQHGFAYLSLQELATRISHRATGKKIGDPVGFEVMKRVAADENLHQLFYRDLAKAAIDVDPNGMMIAIDDEVTNFAMPGVGIPNFNEHAKRIANAGIYDLAVHYEQILAPVVLRVWDVESVEGLNADGERARDHLMAFMTKAERVANRLSERRERQAAKELTTA